ncbi:MAG: glutamate decarboxylase, partial [Bacteroidales bacterium]|nr:glutamate decarboxylase [Bacteroidales bacterium]
GYKAVQENCMEIARYMWSEIGKMPQFKNYAKEVVNPLFIWHLDPEYDKKAKWTLYDLQARLQQSGWMIPAYTLPANLTDIVVMRAVVKQGFTRDLADMLLADICSAVKEFEKLEYPTSTRLAYEKAEKLKGRVFTH